MNLIAELLSSDDVMEQMGGLKQLKNALIGHVDRKSEMLADCIIIQVLGILESGISIECQTEAAIIIGSFAHGSEDTVARLLEYPTVRSLLACLEGLRDKSSAASNNGHHSGSNIPGAESYRAVARLNSMCLRALVTLLEARGPTAVSGYERKVVALIHQYISQPPTSSAILGIGYNPSMDMLSQCFRMIPLLSGNNALVQCAGAFGGSGSELELGVLTPHVASHIALLTHQYKKTGQQNLPLDTALAALSKCVTASQAKDLLCNGLQNSPISGDEFVDTLLEYTRAESGAVRLTAVELLARLQKHADSAEQAKMMTLPLLPTIFPLMSDLDSDPRISLCIAYICRDSEHCSELAVEVGLVKQLMDTLKKLDLDNWRHGELIENNLLALSAIGIHRDSFRQAIVDEGVVPYMIAILNRKPADRIGGVKAAACYLLRSLSRSVAMLRTNMANNEIADAVVDLLSEYPDEGASKLHLEHPPASTPFSRTSGSNSMLASTSGSAAFHPSSKADLTSDAEIVPATDATSCANLEVRTSVMATICNLVLEFSPVNKYLLNKGILDEIVSSTHSYYAPLRLNAIWSLKHLIYDASEALKETVMTKLTCKHLFVLWEDPVLSVQEQALEFVRNFVSRNENGIDLMINSNQFFTRLHSKLSLADSHPNIALPCVYIMVHIAASCDRHKDKLVNEESLLKKLIPLLYNDCTELRVACVWVIINLTWMEDQNNEQRAAACKARVDSLINLGVREKLTLRLDDPSIDMKERVKTALYQLESSHART